MHVTTSASAAIFICFILLGASTSAEGIQECRAAWDEFLTKNMTTGLSEDSVRRLMYGKHRDSGILETKSGVRSVVFLLDDFHQVTCAFDRHSRLLYVPYVEPKAEWLRKPSGTIELILSALELEAKKNAEELAIAHIADKFGHGRSVLHAFARRGNKVHSWEVVVMLRNLEVDSPNYLLEVSDSGEVAKLHFEDR